ISWADRVVSFTPGNPAPRRSKDPEAALGKPDFRGRDDEEDQRHYISLGHGGELILEFTDNLLIDGPGPDLAVFEVVDAVEPVDVAISVDGKTWVNVGRVKGATSTLDIGAFVNPEDRFRFVRLTDAKAGLSNDSAWPGADIDAVGAINTIPVRAVPDGFPPSRKDFISLFGMDGVPGGWTVRRWNDVSKPADGDTSWIVKD